VEDRAVAFHEVKAGAVADGAEPEIVDLHKHGRGARSGFGHL
jgi:hypothetical protein